ncbi:MAG TPA: hypothetical protein QGF02_01760 [Candidatus Babeliales bacterium]|nr:hypothetical protein [Candidatus Babeliales bacterium]
MVTGIMKTYVPNDIDPTLREELHTNIVYKYKECQGYVWQGVNAI